MGVVLPSWLWLQTKAQPQMAVAADMAVAAHMAVNNKYKHKKMQGLRCHLSPLPSWLWLQTKAQP